MILRILNLKSSISYRQLYISIFSFLFLLIILSSGFQNVSEVLSLGICLVSFLIGTSLNEKKLYFLFKIIYIFSAFASTLVFMQVVLGIKTFGVDFRFQYLPSSFLQAVFTLGTFSIILFSKNNLFFKIIFLYALFSQFLNFGRGSIILSLLILIINFLIVNYYKKKYLKIIFLIFISILIINVVVQFLINNGLLDIRILRLFTDISQEPRLEVWSRFFYSDFNIFFGGGMGFYNTIHSSHPHNSLLQLIEDSGIIGAFIFLFLVLISLKRYIENFSNNTNSLTNVFFFSLLLLYFITSQFSGNFYYNYGLFLFLGTAFVKKKISNNHA
jgi:O-antigen ligase